MPAASEQASALDEEETEEKKVVTEDDFEERLAQIRSTGTAPYQESVDVERGGFLRYLEDIQTRFWELRTPEVATCLAANGGSVLQERWKAQCEPTVRLATRADAAAIAKLIRELAETLENACYKFTIYCGGLNSVGLKVR